MKKLFAFFALAIFSFSFAQEKVSANRFFYELTFKPKKNLDSLDKVMTILDVTAEKSLYKDFTMTAQDSIMKIQVEAMQKSGVYKDLSKSFVMPKFSHRISKDNATKETTYIEQISSGFTPIDLGYKENNTFDWKISPDTQKIGEWKCQKATAYFGGRTWTAWFSSEIPLQDGPYKFHGLPGLIVKIEDTNKEYSWELKGTKKIDDWEEKSYIEKMSPMGQGTLKIIKREKFEKTFNQYKKDPFATVRPLITKEMKNQKMPGSDKTIGDMINQQEKMVKDLYNANNNPIEK